MLLRNFITTELLSKSWAPTSLCKVRCAMRILGKLVKPQEFSLFGLAEFKFCPLQFCHGICFSKFLGLN